MREINATVIWTYPTSMIGLQAVSAVPERVRRLNLSFEAYRSGDQYDWEAITHVMACSAHFPDYLLRTFGHSALAGASGS